MDIINHLQAYKAELEDACNKLPYHEESRVAGLLNKVDELIKAIAEDGELGRWRITSQRLKL
jgi:hypothetical protein